MEEADKDWTMMSMVGGYRLTRVVPDKGP